MFQNKRKRRGRGKLVIALLLFLFTLTTFATVTYAWWNTLVVKQDEKIEVGERIIITTDANSKAGFDFGTGLVPKETALINGQVDNVTGTIKFNITGIDPAKGKVDLVITNNLPIELQNVFIITYNNFPANTVGGKHTAVIEDVANGLLSVTITIELIGDNDPNKYTPGVLATLVNEDYDIIFTFELVRPIPIVPQP